MLKLTNIRKKYALHEVLNFDEWAIGSGVYWIKGGNGSGKSTLFRIISGQTVFDGIVEFENIDLKKEPINFRSKISFAEAEPQYPSFITGQELLNFYVETRRSSKKQAQHLADYFDMVPYLSHKIGGYSSGMLKKLSLICIFIGNPDLYILDEPLITIDTASTDKLYRLLADRALQGKTILLSSHQDVDNDQLKIDGVFEIVAQKIVERSQC